MTLVKIIILNESGEGVPFVRTKEYNDKAEVCADAPQIMEFITNLVE